jgi:hypothetical protein
MAYGIADIDTIWIKSSAPYPGKTIIFSKKQQNL